MDDAIVMKRTMRKSLAGLDEHLSRIEVSLEWEDVLTDARCADVLKSIVPELRDGKYADACAKAVRAMEVFFPK